MPDPVSPELRAIEHQVDREYESNGLLPLSFAQAAWYFLSLCEDYSIRHLMRDDPNSTRAEIAAEADTLVVHIRHPLHWLWKNCSRGEEIPDSYDDDMYGESWDLSKLGMAYTSFESAFTLASLAQVELGIENHTVFVKTGIPSDFRYEAYDRLSTTLEPSPKIDTDALVESIGQTLKIDGEHFTYDLNPKLALLAQSSLSPLTDMRYSLPGEWMLAGFSLKEFGAVSRAVSAIAFIHAIARKLAATAKCPGMGYASSLRIFDSLELIQRLTRYSGVSRDTVEKIVSLLTYGSVALLNPDPALQPLIPLSKDKIAIAPSLLLSSSMERNLIALINRLPEHRDAYASLVIEKEQRMRDRILKDLTIQGLRSYFGKPWDDGTPDIDLALISDSERFAMILELKWFIEPAEIREVRNKSEEIEKGIGQLLKISTKLSIDPAKGHQALKIDPTFKLGFAVLSEGFIGLDKIQKAGFPAIRRGHYVEKVNSEKDLGKVAGWMLESGHLPISGKHFDVEEVSTQVGDYHLRWYQIRPLEPWTS